MDLGTCLCSALTWTTVLSSLKNFLALIWALNQTFIELLGFRIGLARVIRDDVDLVGFLT